MYTQFNIFEQLTHRFTFQGSTVATSLANGEAGEKKVALLKVCGTRMKLTPITLQTVRPFVFAEITLDEPTLNFDNANAEKQTRRFLEKKIKETLAKIKEDYRGEVVNLTKPNLISFKISRQTTNVTLNSTNSLLPSRLSGSECSEIWPKLPRYSS